MQTPVIPRDVPGMHKVSLETLRGRHWVAGGEGLTGEQVIAYYLAIRRGDLAGICRSHLQWGKASQILKKLGLVRYVGGDGWRCVDQIAAG